MNPECPLCPSYKEPSEIVKGDFDGDGQVTDKDSTYLLYHTFFPGDYPLNQDGDMNGDGQVTDADATHLLYHTFYPNEYPLGKQEQEKPKEDEREVGELNTFKELIREIRDFFIKLFDKFFGKKE